MSHAANIRYMEDVIDALAETSTCENPHHTVELYTKYECKYCGAKMEKQKAEQFIREYKLRR